MREAMAHYWTLWNSTSCDCLHQQMKVSTREGHCFQSCHSSGYPAKISSPRRHPHRPSYCCRGKMTYSCAAKEEGPCLVVPGGASCGGAQIRRNVVRCSTLTFQFPEPSKGIAVNISISLPLSYPCHIPHAGGAGHVSLSLSFALLPRSHPSH